MDLVFMLLAQHLLQLLDVLEMRRPFTGLEADDSAADLGHPLQEQQPRRHG